MKNEIFHQFVVVFGGAGCGKTRRFVEPYVDLLRKEYGSSFALLGHQAFVSKMEGAYKDSRSSMWSSMWDSEFNELLQVQRKGKPVALICEEFGYTLNPVFGLELLMNRGTCDTIVMIAQSPSDEVVMKKACQHADRIVWGRSDVSTEGRIELLLRNELKVGPIPSRLRPQMLRSYSFVEFDAWEHEFKLLKPINGATK